MAKAPEIRSSIVFDEVNATLNRVQLVMNNSDNPVEVFVAAQVSNVLSNVVADVGMLLMNPSLDATAEQFVKALKKQNSEEHPLPEDR